MLVLLALIGCTLTLGETDDTGGGGQDTLVDTDTDVVDTEDSDTEDTDTEDTDTEDTDTEDTDTEDTDTEDTDTEDTDTDDTDTEDTDTGVEVVDADGDGIPEGVDCDDTDAAVTTYTWYYDGDGDGAGVDTDTVDACAAPTDYVATGGDCNDGDPSVSPLATETWYDGVDQDCSGGSDNDQDGDGYEAETQNGDDCDDTRSTVNPGAVEVWYDGVDQDCSGGSDNDQDGDGAEAESTGGTDCDDTNPDAKESQSYYADTDGDGYGDGNSVLAAGCVAQPTGSVPNLGDCDDSSSAVNPDASEVCGNSVDDDCSGRADDGCGPIVLGRNDAIIFTGEAQSDMVGSGVTVGDFNADGQPDLAVGSQTGSRNDSNLGEVFLVYGPISQGGPLPTLADHTLTGPPPPEQFGHRLLAGELDGTPGDELVVHDFNYPNAKLYSFADPTTATGASDATATFEGRGQVGLQSRITLGEVDGDDTLELLLSSLGPEGSYDQHEGRVVVFNDPLTSGFADAADTIVVGEKAFDAAENPAVAFNGSSIVLLSGAPNAEQSGQPNNSGVVYQNVAPFEASAASVVDRWHGSCANGGLGYPANLGDLNGDGAEEVGMVASYHGGGCTLGAAFVVDGTDVGTGGILEVSTVSTLWESERTTESLRNIGAAGDLNGDGYDDFFVGIPYSGKIIVLYGPHSYDRSGDDVDWLINLGSNPLQLGVADMEAGDVTGDGLDDLIVPAGSDNVYTGAVFVYPGR